MPVEFGTPERSSGSTSPRPRTKRTENDSSASSPPATPRLTARPQEWERQGSEGPSLSQARLDRISRPTDAWFRGKLTWLARLTDREQWPDAVMQARIEALGQDAAALERLVRNPPPDLTGARWLLLEERLQSWRGQMDAITETLTRRRR